MKLKLNIGYNSFQQSKKAYPCKFQHKKFEKDATGNNNKLLMKNWYFKENPHLLEFARKPNPNSKDDNLMEDNTAENLFDVTAKKKKEESLLVWGNPQFGIYDRYGTGECWMLSGPGNDSTCPSIGHYFQTDEPLRCQRIGKDFHFVRKVKSINDR